MTTVPEILSDVTIVHEIVTRSIVNEIVTGHCEGDTATRRLVGEIVTGQFLFFLK